MRRLRRAGASPRPFSSVSIGSSPPASAPAFSASAPALASASSPLACLASGSSAGGEAAWRFPLIVSLNRLLRIIDYRHAVPGAQSPSTEGLMMTTVCVLLDESIFFRRSVRICDEIMGPSLGISRLHAGPTNTMTCSFTMAASTTGLPSSGENTPIDTPPRQAPGPSLCYRTDRSRLLLSADSSGRNRGRRSRRCKT